MDKYTKKEIATHKASYFMYEKTKKETFERMSEAMNPDGSKKWDKDDINERINQIQQMQDDVKMKFLHAGGNPDELTSLEDTVETPKIKKQVTVKKTTKNKNTIESNAKKPIVKKASKNVTTEEIQSKNPQKIEFNQRFTEPEVPVVPQNWNTSVFSE
jgi:hypothetical protein